ncbi:hypothetical protein EBS40_04075 [bacterium]|nr:hypothetical protein [bacterium]NDG19227.1 hypothetical protein [Betaproteobacteria bacterium]
MDQENTPEVFATPLPKLRREARAALTREKEARRKPWSPPSKLDAPPAPDGFKNRWIRRETMGFDDRINVTTKLREGYELVRADEHPDYTAPTVDDGKHAGIIGVGALILARIPEETVEERNAYYQNRARDQQRAVDNELLKSNAHDSMRINSPDRRTRTTFGSRNSA